MIRLLLVRHASTDAASSFAFPDDEPLDARGRESAAILAKALPRGCEAICSPALRCRQTAGAAGLRPRIEPLVRECDFGRWAGRTLAEIEPAEAGEWMRDPDRAPHGGETLRDFAARVARWLEAQIDPPTRLKGAAEPAARAHRASRPRDEVARCRIVITHGGVVRAAVVHALGAPLDAFWRLDVAPLSVTELTGRAAGGWTLKRIGAAA